MNHPVHSTPCAVCPVLLRCVEADGYSRHCACGRELRPDDGAERRVRAMVSELRMWRRSQLLADHTGGTSFVLVGSDRSSMAPALAAAELGVVGTGNRGTKGVWRGEPPEPMELHGVTAPDEATARRYGALRGRDREAADVVLADPYGEVLAAVALGARVLDLSLAQRVAWALASAGERDRWAAEIAARDSLGALREMAELGRRLLASACESWGLAP